ncbi:MAG: shikimate kinase [Proteobacteria bacterium]|nr:shikimate kinase [Pseudomonadota bacterium]
MEKIYLIGFMASGKTTIGKVLAEKLGWVFIDTDEIIERKKGMPIKEIFSTYGEMYFRELEREVLEDLKDMDKVVVSVGGGMPVFFDNLEIMKSTGYTVYLYVSEDVLLKRLKNNEESQKRPIVSSNSENDLLNLFRERKGVYEKAHAKFNCDNMTPIEIAENISESFLSWKSSH